MLLLLSSRSSFHSAWDMGTCIHIHNVISPRLSEECDPAPPATPYAHMHGCMFIISITLSQSTNNNSMSHDIFEDDPEIVPRVPCARGKVVSTLV